MIPKHIILVVDDDHDDFMLLEDACQESKLHCELVFAQSAQQALSYLQESPPPLTPSLMLLDVNMPVTNGLELLSQLKSDVRTRPLPVLMLSTSGAADTINQAYHLGANSYLVKPLTYEAMSTMIKSVYSHWLEIVTLPQALPYSVVDPRKPSIGSEALPK